MGLPSSTEIFGRFFSKLHSLQSVNNWSFWRFYVENKYLEKIWACRLFFPSHPGHSVTGPQTEKDSLSFSSARLIQSTLDESIGLQKDVYRKLSETFFKRPSPVFSVSLKQSFCQVLITGMLGTYIYTLPVIVM